jgi:ornithine cyclodeaminase/alanine dehydrogenase-like protein (mu-crystallin family)
MRLIDVDALGDALDYRDLVEALREGHKAGIDAFERSLISEGAGSAANHLLTLPAWRYGDLLGAKLVTVFPANSPPVPTIQTVYVLFSGRNGTPLASMSGAAFTLRKTAADSALGADFLARPDVRRMLMVGAGNQAPHQIRAHCAVRPSIARVEVWNRTPEKARALPGTLVIDGVEIAAAADLESAARQADLICCATGATTSLIRGEWLKPGTHLDLVGGFTPQMREADDEAIRRARVFVDSRWFTVDYCGDLTQPIASGVLAAADVAGDLFELASGRRPGRRSAEEITLFKNAGGGHLDLMTAGFIWRRVAARASGPSPGSANR